MRAGPVHPPGVRRFRVAAAHLSREAHDCRILQDWVALGLGSALLPGPKVAAGTPARPVQRGEVPVTIAYQACWMATSPLRTEISGLVSMLTAMS